MKHRIRIGRSAVRAILALRPAWRGSWPWARGLVWLGLLGAVLGVGPSPVTAAQQTPDTNERMTIRPQALATGTTTAHAGIQPLDSLFGGDSLLAESWLYVPKRSVGAQRSPLLVVMHGFGKRGLSPLKVLIPFADSTGIILLAPTVTLQDTDLDRAKVEAALRTVLGHYAIDPSKLGLYGESAGSYHALNWGYVNGDIFSLVIIDSGFGPFDGQDQFTNLGLTGHGTAKFYVALRTAEFENNNMGPDLTALLQKAGRSVTPVKDEYDHGVNPQRAAGEFAWLMKNWP